MSQERQSKNQQEHFPYPPLSFSTPINNKQPLSKDILFYITFFTYNQQLFIAQTLPLTEPIINQLLSINSYPKPTCNGFTSFTNPLLARRGKLHVLIFLFHIKFVLFLLNN
jgi:hypothetical protein